MAELYQKSTHSPSSTSSKMTPQTSSTSTIGLSNKSRDVSYGSSLLQERLKDKKAESLRVKKRPTKSDLRYDDSLQHTQSSPVGRKESASHEKEVRRPSTSGGIGMTAKKSMGAKEMEDTLSSLHKQNFDLKLELFHRRQKQSTLEQRLEEAEAQIAEQDAQLAEQDEMQEINDQLLLELEKRDQAVEEAVSMICKLETEVDKLKRNQSIVESFDSTYTPVQNRSEQSLVSHDICSSPPTASRHAQLARIPSFLSDESEGVETLRSVYQHNLQQTLSSDSLPMLDEEDREGMHSPGLSVLSKSSFLSVYGTAEDDDQGYDISNREDNATLNPGSQNKDMTETRAKEPRPRVATPLRRTRALSHERAAQFQSINDILGSPLQRLEKLQRSMTQSVQSFDSSTQTSFNEKRSQSVNRPPRQALKIKPSDLKRSVTDDGLAKKHELPPTPDTISTSTLDLHQKADDIMQPHTGYTSHKQGPHSTIGRRRSTDERFNRREELESDTQSSYTQTATDSHQGSIDPWMELGNSPGRRKKNSVARGPKFFAFGDLEDRSRYNENPTSTRWKETITKMWEEPITGSSPASNLRARRASVTDGPAFNPLTAHPTNPKREERRIQFEKGTRFETPMRTVSGPTNLQSSLVHETTLSPESTRVHTSPSSRPSSTEPNVKDSIRNRFTPKIFKRSETVNSFQFKQPISIGKATRGFNEHTRFSSVEVDRVGDDKGLNVGRPRTAVESRLPVSRRRGNAFGGDGADDDDEVDVGGVKAWLGIGKRRASFGFGSR